MAKKSNLIGSWAFLIGVLLAIILGLFGNLNYGLTVTLVVIGLIVGLLNVGDEEATPFLMSGAVLIIASYFGRQEIAMIAWFADVLYALLLIFVPATIIVAIKNVFSIAKH